MNSRFDGYNTYQNTDGQGYGRPMMAPQARPMMAPQRAPMPAPQSRAQFDAQQKHMQEMQAKYQAQMAAARKAHEEKMKQWAAKAPVVPAAAK